MRITTIMAAALVLSTAPALAQNVYYNGEPVQFLNADTGQWEAATITAITGSGADARYNVQGNVISVGHTVNANEIRTPAGYQVSASDVAAAVAYDSTVEQPVTSMPPSDQPAAAADPLPPTANTPPSAVRRAP